MVGLRFVEDEIGVHQETQLESEKHRQEQEINQFLRRLERVFQTIEQYSRGDSRDESSNDK